MFSNGPWSDGHACVRGLDLGTRTRRATTIYSISLLTKSNIKNTPPLVDLAFGELLGSVCLFWNAGRGVSQRGNRKKNLLNFSTQKVKTLRIVERFADSAELNNFMI